MLIILVASQYVNTLGYGEILDDKLDRQQWLNAGLRRLTEHGPEGLGITTIAQQLGVTKGSFYWHFKDKTDYVSALLEEWERSRTQLIIDHVEQPPNSAIEKLRKLLMFTVTADQKLTIAVRSWARTDAIASKAIQRVDNKRLAYVAQLIVGLGWSSEDAATLAHWHYSALIGHFSLRGKPLTQAQGDLILGLLTR